MPLLADWQHETATLLPCHQHCTQLLWFWVTVVFLNISLQIGSSQENFVCFDPRRIDDLRLVSSPPSCLPCPPRPLPTTRNVRLEFPAGSGEQKSSLFQGSGHRARVAGERGAELAAEPHCYLQHGLMLSVGAAMQTVGTLWWQLLKAFEGGE